MAWHVPDKIQDIIAGYFAECWENVDYAWRLPVSSPYGVRVDPITGAMRNHDGIDIPIPRGTRVIAVYDGKIDQIDTLDPDTGNAVYLTAGPWRFCYFHLDVVQVQKGQYVTRGEVLGLSGSTGRSTGPHLHFQVTLADLLINPRIFYPGALFR